MDEQTVIATSAVVIALISLVVAVWEGVQTRRHNKLSLLPCMRIDRLLLSSPGSPPMICLLSTGVGPAIIRKFSVTVDGKDVVGDDPRPAVNALKQLGIDHACAAYTPEPGDTFAPGEVKNLIEVLDFPGDFGLRCELRRTLKRLEFNIEFASVYGEVTLMERPQS
jgi:hypothetical protein